MASIPTMNTEIETDTQVPVEPLGLPPLKGKLHKERYSVLKPIKPQRGG